MIITSIISIKKGTRSYLACSVELTFYAQPCCLTISTLKGSLSAIYHIATNDLFILLDEILLDLTELTL